MAHRLVLGLPLAGAVLLSTALHGQDASPSADARARWLAENAVPLTSDSLDEALRRFVGDARIVMLGEAGHGDGTTFEIKTDLSKRLHAKLGFDVLAFESGLYDCARMWQEQRDEPDFANAAGQAVFGIWADSAQVAPLWDYLSECAATDRPLELAGMDSQLTGAWSLQIVDEVRSVLGEAADDEALAPCMQALTWMRDQAREPMETASAETRAEIFASAVHLAEALDRVGSAEARLLAQTTRSHMAFLRFFWGWFIDRDRTKANVRDAQMAENLLWLARGPFEGRKIIVWGATSHLSRNRQKIDTDVDPEMVPAGHHLHQAIGDQVRAVGFVCGGGRSGISRAGAPRHDIDPPPPGSLGAWFAEAGLDACFLDLTGELPDWLREPFVARPMGHAARSAPWAEVLDAIVWIPEMSPSELAEGR